MREYRFYVYIMASKSRTLYIGFTSAIENRVWQHKNGVFDGFSKTYNCDRLVYLEQYQTAVVAIAREKQLKRWSRAKKITLIESENPTWEDLAAQWGEPIELLKPDLVACMGEQQVSPLPAQKRAASVEMTRYGWV